MRGEARRGLHISTKVNQELHDLLSRCVIWVHHCCHQRCDINTNVIGGIETKLLPKYINNDTCIVADKKATPPGNLLGHCAASPGAPMKPFGRSGKQHA
jgi:hypothetical protein